MAGHPAKARWVPRCSHVIGALLTVSEAYARLILWMEEDFGWNRWKAYDLLTHVGEISVGYYGIGTVGTKIDRRYLDDSS